MYFFIFFISIYTLSTVLKSENSEIIFFFKEDLNFYILFSNINFKTIILFLIINIIIIIVPVLISVAFLTLIERKIMAAIQRRRGPNIIGFFGILQPFADGLKLLTKEFNIPARSFDFLVVITPMLSLLFTCSCFSLIPLCYSFICYTSNNVSALYVMAISSLNIYSIIMAGWASKSAYAFLGSLRASAQFISYEVSLTLNIMGIFMISSSFDLSEILYLQELSIPNLIIVFPLFILYLVGILSETNRTPFDLAEAESELVAGYGVEFSAVGFAYFFIAEYGSIILYCILTIVLFGGNIISLIQIIYSYFLYLIAFIVLVFFYLYTGIFTILIDPSSFLVTMEFCYDLFSINIEEFLLSYAEIISHFFQNYTFYNSRFTAMNHPFINDGTNFNINNYIAKSYYLSEINDEEYVLLVENTYKVLGDKELNFNLYNNIFDETLRYNLIALPLNGDYWFIKFKILIYFFIKNFYEYFINIFSNFKAVFSFFFFNYVVVCCNNWFISYNFTENLTFLIKESDIFFPISLLEPYPFENIFKISDFFILDCFFFGLKIVSILILFCFIRATFARFRFDQLMKLNWKNLLLISLILDLYIAIIIKLSVYYSEENLSIFLYYFISYIFSENELEYFTSPFLEEFVNQAFILHILKNNLYN
jgi:NADH:ubiquinone oxidoreductase subunit H